MQESNDLFSIRHDFLHLGKYLNFRNSGVESGEMTALVSVYTNEGFVFGADGRRLDPTKTKIERDDAQKIFGCRAANISALFGWSGSPIIGTALQGLDFRLNTLAIAAGYERESFKSLFEYAETIADSINSRIRKFMARERAGFDPECEEIARLMMVGYANGIPQSALVILSATNGELNSPVLDGAIDRPTSFLQVASGRKGVYLAMVESGRMLPCNTLTEGRGLIREYIESCINESTQGVNTIGGHIHIAAVTPSDSQWMVPPKP